MLAKLNLPSLVVLGGRSAHYAQVPLEDYYRRTVVGAQVLRYELSGIRRTWPSRRASRTTCWSSATRYSLRRAQPKSAPW